jgi:dipeptidase
MKLIIPISAIIHLSAGKKPFPDNYNPQKGIIADIGCTAIAVDSEATIDGSAMSGMNVDCAQCDNRVTYIESKDFSNQANATRLVYANFGAYPRFIAPGRSELYDPENNPDFPEFIPIGEIAQPPMKTFGYWESTLPLMNEAGLSIGESSCGTKLVGDPNALLDITELLRLAAERCATARCAVDTLGALSDEYGFLAMKNEITPGTEADGKPGFDDAGEAAVFADSTGEAWVFHVTGGVPGISKSTWAAQKVPKGHLVVLANAFIIGDLPSEPNEEFRFNPNIRQAARSSGLWEGTDTDPIHFTRTFGIDTVSFQRKPTELPIPLYTSLRTWRVLDLVAPSMKLPVDVDNTIYPFSVKPDSLLSHRDLFRIFGDYYQDSEFDMREGILAGPFGNPYRLEGGNGKSFAQFPRAISIPRTSYSIVGQSKKVADESIAWFASDQPMTSVYVPLLAKVRSVKQGLAEAYQVGSLWEFDRKSAFWAFDFVSNWMNMNWRNTSTEEVFPLQQKLQDEIDRDIAAGRGDASWQKAIQEKIIGQWWDLADRLIVKYNDGYYTRVGGGVSDPIIGKSYGYPDWYSRMIGQSPDVHPIWVEPATSGEATNQVQLEQIQDTNSIPRDIYKYSFVYEVPRKFDFETKQWIMDVGTPSSSMPGSDIGNGSFGLIVLSGLVGIAIGFYVSNLRHYKRGGSESEPLLAK